MEVAWIEVLHACGQAHDVVCYTYHTIADISGLGFESPIAYTAARQASACSLRISLLLIRFLVNQCTDGVNFLQ
jgi:hypothetical protein